MVFMGFYPRGQPVGSQPNELQAEVFVMDNNEKSYGSFLATLGGGNRGAALRIESVNVNVLGDVVTTTCANRI